jgi:hypothetical protein
MARLNNPILCLKITPRLKPAAIPSHAVKILRLMLWKTPSIVGIWGKKT